MELNVIDRNIRNIRNGYATQRQRVQDTLLGIMGHAEEHGDCTRALGLCMALPLRMRPAAIKYLARFSPIHVQIFPKYPEKNRVGFRSTDSKYRNEFNLTAAADVQWDEPSEEELAEITLDLTGFRDEVGKFIERMTRLADGTSKGRKQLDPSVREQAAAELTAIQNALVDVRTEEPTAMPAAQLAA